MRTRLLALVVKEFQAIWRDSKARFVLFVPPLIQAVLFGYAATMEVNHISLAVLNRDAGRHGRELVERFRGSRTFSNIVFVASEREIRETVDAQRVLLAVSIPPDFSRDILAHRGGRIQAVLDGRRSNSAQIALGYVNAVVERLAAETAGRTPAAEGVARTWFNPNRNYAWFTVPSLIGTLMALQALLLTGLAVARERELGTFDQLLVSPVSPGEIILGKTIPSLVIGLLAGTLILGLAVFWFRVPLAGSIPLLYLSMTTYLLSMIGLGLLVSALAATQQQALLGTFVIFLPVVLLSGFMTPVENMPRWLQIGSIWNPLRYFLILVKGVFLKDLPFGMALGNLLPLGAIAAVSLVSASWLFHRRLG